MLTKSKRGGSRKGSGRKRILPDVPMALVRIPSWLRDEFYEWRGEKIKAKINPID